MKQWILVKFLCYRVYFWAIFYATGYRVLSGLPHTSVISLVKYPPPPGIICPSLPEVNNSYCFFHFSNRSREPETDRIITSFEEHEDSVYIVEWSTADPWIFASLSYDGRIVINRVPRAEKYKILL